MSSQIEKRQYGEWEDLPTDLLPAIAKRLTSVADYSSFRGVCKSWRSAATFHNFSPRLPLLLYFTKEGKRISTNLLDLVTNIRRKCSNLVPPEPGRDYPCLSCSDWILQSSKDGDVHLTNIVGLKNIKLPDWTTFPGYSQKDNFGLPVRKMVLSGSPTVNADVVIMVIWGRLNQLAFCRPGDKSWTIFPKHNGFSDLIYHHGKLYAVDIVSTVVECDIHALNPTKIVQVFAFPYFSDNCFSYFCDRHNYLVMVESSGKLLIVSRYIGCFQTCRFRIFEINLKKGSFKEIDNLGDRCLFLGLNSSICVERAGELNNCIYFTNTNKFCYCDTGVCRLSDNGRSIENFVSKLGITFYSPPIWILPTL